MKSLVLVAVLSFSISGIAGVGESMSLEECTKIAQERGVVSNDESGEKAVKVDTIKQ